MTKIDVINLQGEKVKTLTLKDDIWKIAVNDSALKKMIRLQLAASRQGTRKTKNRSEVSGGGRKPWRQKGTGRARQGSIRATQWRGGGIPIGVKPMDYSFKINKKERVLALKSALTNKMQEKKVVVFDNFNLKTTKTKDALKILDALKLTAKVLFVTTEDNENFYLATRNLPNVLVLFSDELNCFDILNADVLAIDEKAIDYIEEVLK